MELILKINLCLISFKSFNLYGEASKNHKFVIIQISDQFLCIISTSTDSHNTFVRYNLKVLHHCKL